MAHQDLDTLINRLLPFAQQMLAKRGSFFPFGACLRSDGKIAMAAAFLGEEDSEPVDMIEFIVRGFREEAGKGMIRAAGLCIDIRVVPPSETEKTDAICLHLEHVEGDCINYYYPYKKRWLGRLKFGQMFSLGGKALVFITQGLGDG